LWSVIDVSSTCVGFLCQHLRFGHAL
jgi:hypothetical protein